MYRRHCLYRVVAALPSLPAPTAMGVGGTPYVLDILFSIVTHLRTVRQVENEKFIQC